MAKVDDLDKIKRRVFDYVSSIDLDEQLNSVIDELKAARECVEYLRFEQDKQKALIAWMAYLTLSLNA